MPGILTGLAAVITAIGSLLTFLYHIDVIGPIPTRINHPQRQGQLENLSELDKVGPTNAVGPNAPPSVSYVSLERIRRSIKVYAEKSLSPVDTLPNGQIRHLYSIWIQAPRQIMSQIARVLYQYDHSAFSTPRTQSSDPNNGFRDSYRGIGAVNADMDVILVLHNGEQVNLKFNMYKAIFGK